MCLPQLNLHWSIGTTVRWQRQNTVNEGICKAWGIHNGKTFDKTGANDGNIYGFICSYMQLHGYTCSHMLVYLAYMGINAAYLSMNSSILLGWLNEYWCRIFGSWFNHFGHQVGHILKIYIKPILILLSRSFGQYGQDYLFQMLKQIRGKALKKKIKSESLWFIWDYMQITTKKILYNWNKFYCKISHFAIC